MIMKIEEIAATIQKRLGAIEEEIRSRFLAERENQPIRATMLLEERIKTLPDVKLYLALKKNDILVEVEHATNDLSFTKRVSDIRNKAIAKIGEIPADIDEQGIVYLLNNAARKDWLAWTRKKIIGLLDSKTRSSKKKLRKAIEQALKEEKADLIGITGQIDEHFIATRILEEELTDAFERLREAAIDEKSFKELVEWRSQRFDAQDPKDLLRVIEKHQEATQRRTNVEFMIEELKKKIRSEFEQLTKLFEQISPHKEKAPVPSEKEAPVRKQPELARLRYA
jgi:hypothetical protein